MAPARQAGGGGASCSTAESRRRACSATRTRSSGGSSGRSSAALRAGDVELALATAQESFELCRERRRAAFTRQRPPPTWRPHCSRRASRTGPSSCSSAPSGGEELALIAGSPRARYLEVLARAWLALGRPADARRAAAWRGAVGLEPCGCRWRPCGPVVRRRPSRSQTGEPSRAAERALASAAAADEVGAPVEAALSRTLAGRALAAAGEPDRAAAELEQRGPRVRGARRAALPRRGRARATEARPPHPPPHTSRQARRDRRRIADRARAPARAARRRPQDEPADRRRALPQPEDGRDATCATSSARSASPRASSSRARSSTPTARASRGDGRRRAVRARRRPRFAKTDPAHQVYDRVAGDDRAPEVPGRRDRARSRGRADLAT